MNLNYVWQWDWIIFNIFELFPEVYIRGMDGVLEDRVKL